MLKLVQIKAELFVIFQTIFFTFGFFLIVFIFYKPLYNLQLLS